jgi:sugar lactone lactonase YvrE
MKKITLFVLLLLTGALVTGAYAQQSVLASLFNAYDVNPKWAQLPPDLPWGGETSSVAADGKGRVVVLMRVPPHFREFTSDGKFVKSWGEKGMFNVAHSIQFDREGTIWATDPNDHVVHKFDRDGKIVMTLGKKGMAGDNAARDMFNRPNNLAFGVNGDIFVSDGYNNSRIVQFAKDGKFIKIIGGVKGTGPGQLQLPHGVGIDSRGRIIVADSDNKRVAVFDKDGKFITNYSAPGRGNLVVTADDHIYVSDVNGGAVTVLDKDGKLIDVIKVDGRPHGLGIDPTTMDVYTASSVVPQPNITKSSKKKPASN